MRPATTITMCPVEKRLSRLRGIEITDLETALGRCDLGATTPAIHPSAAVTRR
jgi:hypothetical protein